MTEHTWIQEDIDGGHLGVNTFWTCSTCGAAGGPVLLNRRTGANPTAPRWRPFIPGPAKSISSDCQEAQREIRAYIDERLQGMRERWHASTGEHRLYAPLFQDVLLGTPEATNVLPVLDLIQDVELPARTNGRRMTVAEVGRALLNVGFRETPKS